MYAIFYEINYLGTKGNFKQLHSSQTTTVYPYINLYLNEYASESIQLLKYFKLK